MTHKLIKLIALFLIVTGLTGLQAQTSVNATGGNASGTGGTVSYSVGQTSYHANTGTTGSVSEGIQQPYEIFVITSIEEAKDINLSAYPNPTSNYLTLEIKGIDIADLSYQLYDLQGNLLQTQKITDIQTPVSMENLAAATYFIKIIRETNEIKTFKIIKNN